MKQLTSEYIHHNYFENKNQVNICLYRMKHNRMYAPADILLSDSGKWHISYFHYNITIFLCKKNSSIHFDTVNINLPLFVVFTTFTNYFPPGGSSDSNAENRFNFYPDTVNVPKPEPSYLYISLIFPFLRQF